MQVYDHNVIIVTGFDPHAPSVPVTIPMFATDTGRAVELVTEKAPTLKIMSAMSAVDVKALYVQFEAIAQGLIPAVICEDGLEANPAGLVSKTDEG